MPREIGEPALRIAAWIIVVSGAMLPFQKPGTAEFILTAASFGLGLLFGAIVLILMRRDMK